MILQTKMYSFLFVLFFTTVGQAAIYMPKGSNAALVASVIAANTSPQDDIIDLGGYSYVFDGSATYQNETLNAGAFSALPPIISNGKLSIINGAIKRSLINSTPAFRLIYNNGGSLTLFNITINNGSINSGYNSGGGIYSNGILSIENCVFNANSASNFGGALFNAGTITMIEKSLITNNLITVSSGNGEGAGIYNQNVINAINNSSIDNNQIVFNSTLGNGEGAGIFNQYIINAISNSTIANNSIVLNGASTMYAEGAGILNQYAIYTLINTTIANNTLYAPLGTGAGAGILNKNILLDVANNTIASNTITAASAYGGGIYNQSTITNLFSTIVAQNEASSGADIYNQGSITEEGYNLVGDGSDSGLTTGVNQDIVGTSLSPIDPLLGPLQNNGGVTFTMALNRSSVAINSGFNPYAQAFDQRGEYFSRTVFAMTDIGAYELQNLEDKP